MSKVAAIFFAHSVFWDAENSYGRNLIEVLDFNFKKINPLLKELKLNGWSPRFLVGKAESEVLKTSNHEADVVEFECLANFFQYISNSNIDVLFIWNGFDDHSRRLDVWCKSIDVKVVYLEYGFFLQKNYIRFDSKGLLANSYTPDADYLINIKNADLSDWRSGCRNLFEDVVMDVSCSHARTGRDLVVLQTDFDSSLVLYSPFPTALSFVEFLISSDLDISNVDFRIHPNTQPSVRDAIVSLVGSDHIDNIPNPLLSVHLHERILGVNSTLLSEAVCIGKSPFVFGLNYGQSGFQSGYDLLKNQLIAEELSEDLLKYIFYAHSHLQFHEKHGFNKFSRDRLLQIIN